MAGVVPLFNNDLTQKPGVDTCEYLHVLKIIPAPNEVPISVTIQNLPLGLVCNPSTFTIQGIIQDFNLWHPCKDYISNEINLLPDDAIPFDDCFESLDSDKPLTAGYLKRNKATHYSGRNYGMYGKHGFIRDGNQITQDIIITIISNFGATPIPATMIFNSPTSPKDFIQEYGAKNMFVDDKGNELNSSGYTAHLLSKGFIPVGACGKP